jgi:exodeoxyribonuclease VII small subunit
VNDKSKEKSLDFEKSLVKLENIIEALEGGDLPLNESIKTFEEGVKLTKHCQELLTKAELKIQKLLEKDDGTLDLEDFDDK